MSCFRLLALSLPVVLFASFAWADIHCPECGIEYPESFHYCPKDGTDLEEVRKLMKDREQARPVEATPRPTAIEKPPATPRPAAPAKRPLVGEESWAKSQSVHLPPGYPDANRGDFSILRYTRPGSDEMVVFFKAVLNAAAPPQVDVLSSTQIWPRRSDKSMPSLQEVLARVTSANSTMNQWTDYRDFAGSFSVQGKPLYSPFVGGTKPVSQHKGQHVINRGRLDCEVAQYRTPRPDGVWTHTIKTSQWVPFTFVESRYEDGDSLLLILFGTLDEPQLKEVSALFPR